MAGIVAMFVMYCLILVFAARLDPRPFLKKYRRVMKNVLLKGSMVAAIPINMRISRRQMGVPESICAFSIPLGATINMDGAAVTITVMTLAVAKAFMDLPEEMDDESIKTHLVQVMHKIGWAHPDAGYGSRFGAWLFLDGTEPYNSYGNGSAMRVSSVAWLYHDIDAVRKAARLSAEVTHNHPEGIKGAEATASAIFLARTGHSKEEIRTYIEGEFGYDLSRTCDEIRPTYYHDESCMKTVPEAITAFLEGNSFEDVIRTAVSLGGDCDTLTAIAGSIAEGFYGVPDELKEECIRRLPEDLLGVVEAFLEKISA
jgi:ADP-ribosylglycohydrolase